jgi:hypothetical protein
VCCLCLLNSISFLQLTHYIHHAHSLLAIAAKMEALLNSSKSICLKAGVKCCLLLLLLKLSSKDKVATQVDF